MKTFPLENSKHLDPLMERIGDAQYVLLGEASHGTHEYYTWRAEISKRLIQEKGFKIIAVEGDWPDCFKINKWIKDFPDTEEEIVDVLKSFKRWPTWMWANWEIAAFTSWLKSFNSDKAEKEQISFYGLDIYSLWDSMETIIHFLEKEDPETAEHAKNAIDCFEPYKAKDSYASAREEYSCKEQVINLLQEVRKKASQYTGEREAGLNAEINSLIMRNAERYYRAMTSFDDETWNIRDLHMMESLETIQKYYGEDTKVIIWEHNTHIGDARATDMASHGLLNVGQVARERYGDDAVLVGFGSYEGSVVAGKNWGAEMEKMPVPRAIPGSLEHYLKNNLEADAGLFIFNSENYENPDFCKSKIGHRAIGVVYHPNFERGNYVPSHMCDRYDAFLFFRETKALNPIHFKADKGKTPETYPFGI